MARSLQLIGLGLVATLVWPAVVGAQFPSEVVGFNGPPIDDPEAHEMFQPPQVSGTTSEFIVPNVTGFDNNNFFRASGLQSEGPAALEAHFIWDNVMEPDAWVRLTTFNGAERPNPSLDTRGKVRFKITNRSQIFQGEVGLCIGVRETGGADIPQMQDGGTSGPIEWVGTDTAVNAIIAGPDGLVDTAATGDDVQEYPVGYDIIANDLPAGTAVISPGVNGEIDTTPVGDDENRAGYRIGANGSRLPLPAITVPVSPSPLFLEWDLATGNVFVCTTEDPGTLEWSNCTNQGGGIAGFTGNGTLSDAPDDRGTFEHLAVTNLVDDSATNIDFAIDELRFEATVPDPTPPPSIRGPVVESDAEVEVDCIPDATSAELFIDGGLQGSVTPVDGVATFGSLTLGIGDTLTATQTANGVTSELSPPVVVYAEGTALAENFDAYASQAELEMLWTPEFPDNDRKIQLSTGSAASCQNLVAASYTSGSEVSRVYFSLGSVNGTDEEPLVVTYQFKHDSNSTEARARFELAPDLPRTYGALGFAFSNGIGDAFGEQYTSMTNSPSPIIEGYTSDYFNYDYALTGITRVPGEWHKMEIEVLTDVVNFYIDDQPANPIDPETLTPVWPDGVPRVNDDDFKYIILGTGFATNGPIMMYDNISVTIGDTQLPFGDPNQVESPNVVGPLFPAGTTVDVAGIDDVAATAVAVYVDGDIAESVGGPFPDGTATVETGPLYDGQLVTATQTIGGQASCFSQPVTVAVPAPTVESVLVVGEVLVDVSDVEENLASEVRLYEDMDGDLVLLASVSDPAEDPVEVAVPPLAAGMMIVATQIIGDVESPPSAAVEVEATPPAIAEWLSTSSLPLGLTGHQLVYLDGYIYCLGGRSNASPSAVDNVSYAPVNDDGSIGDWTPTTSLVEARACPGAAAYNGRIYVWGGWTSGYPTINTCRYAEQQEDGSLGPWTTSAITIPDNVDVSPQGTQMDAVGRGPMLHNGTLYIVNGEWDNGVSFGLTNNCYYSTIAGNGDYGPWQLTTPTETVNGSWFHGVAVIEGMTEDYLYRVAGNYGGTTEWDVYRASIQPDASLGAWVEEPLHLPSRRYEIACAVADNKWIFAICGLFGATPQSSVYYTAVDPSTGALVEWREGPAYPETVSRNAAVSYPAGGRTYVLVAGGGPYSGGPRTTSCYYAQVYSESYALTDFADFQVCFDPANPAESQCAEAFDLDNSGFIDLDDFEIMSQRITGP